MQNRYSFYLLSFFTAMTALSAQVLTHRVISAKLLNNYAFLVISLTMLGFAASGAFLAFKQDRLLKSLRSVAHIASAGFALSLIACTAVFYRLQIGPQSFSGTGEYLSQLAGVAPAALLFAIPFFFSGLILGLLLTDRDLPTSKIYAWDLVGSCLGAAGILWLISPLGVENCLMLTALTQPVATFVLLPARSPRALGGVAVTAVLLLIGWFGTPVLFKMNYPAGSMLDDGSSLRLELTRWDPVARIELSEYKESPDPARFNYPSLIGGNSVLHGNIRKMITQNNFAFTFAPRFDGTKATLQGYDETIYAAAYIASSVPKPRALAIGVGGGFDLLTALSFDVSKITGVEVNAATIKILKEDDREYFNALVSHPNVEIVLEEGRHYLASSSLRYDVIQLSGVDTYAGSPGAAHVFSESYLYTVEALELYISRLSDQGILNLMRLEQLYPRHMLRALTTAVTALRHLGVEDPRRHIVMVSSTEKNFVSMLVKRTPFTGEELARLQEWGDKSPYFAVSAAPNASPGLSGYQKFLSINSPMMEQVAIETYPFDISPATDDRPFFFRHSRWNHLFPRDGKFLYGVAEMEWAFVVLVAFTALAATVTILLPLSFLKKLEGLSGATPRLRRYGIFFAAIAVGFMGIEMALMQKFGLLLGHPNYAVSIVLASLLFATGLGAYWSESMLRILKNHRFMVYTLVVVVAAESFGLYSRFPEMVAWSFGSKVAVTFLSILPIGVILGAFLPTALHRLKEEAPHFVPWAWGINGVFSVVAPVLAVGYSITFGIVSLIAVSAVAYLLAAFYFPPPQAPSVSSAAVQDQGGALSGHEVGETV